MGEVVYAAPQFGAHAARSGRAGRGIGTVARVLIVDADPAALAAMSQALQSEGHKTATAFDAAGALAAAGRLGPFDLLIADLDLTPGGSVALADTLRKDDEQLQVLYVSSNKHDERDGADVLERPFSEHDLTQAVASLLWERSRRTP